MVSRAEEWAAAYGDLGREPQTRLMQLPLTILDPWQSADGERQPFKAYTDAKLQELTESIKQHGVIEAICVRPKADGRMEIIAGHNRVTAARLVGLATVPAIVQQLDDAQAAIMLVDSNLQHRETLLPSEKAFAYKLRLESMKRQGQRTDLTCGQIVHKSRDGVSDEESGRQVQRYIRLTYLVSALLDMVDNGKPGFAAAVDLSFLGQDEQIALLEVMEQEHIKAPNGAQAKALRKASADSTTGLTAEDILQVLRPVPSQASPKSKTISVSRDELAGYMPATITTDAEALAYIKQALAYWKETHQGGCHDI